VTDRVAIWGASGHALVVADIVRLQRRTVVGFIDDVDATRRGETFGGARVLGGRECLAGLRADGVRDVVIAIGDCAARLRLADVARQHQFRLTRAIHPHAMISEDVAIGEGTVVCAGVVINPGVVIGENVIINSLASVGHECELGDGVHVGPGAHLGGCARVGRGTWVAIGAVVSHRVVIGDEAVVGAGSVVVRDVPSRVVAFGVPARIVRDVAPDA
jgi:UDP-N-acetylbacillosamine N-acetyltransferase